LPENRYLAQLLNINAIDMDRRLWYGDVFVVRLSENSDFMFQVHDMPQDFESSPLVKSIFQSSWDRKFLEYDMEQEQHFREYAEKSQADKDIIYGRM
jgi:hypothetical protein